MKKTVFLLLALVLFIERPATGEDAETSKPYLTAQRMLSINRSLLVKSESEYRLLLRQESTQPSEDLTRRLNDLRYKITALQEDGARLRSAMPQSQRANEFLKDLLVRRDTAGAPAGGIDVEEEKKLSERLNQVYEMHEKALDYVSKDRLEEACRLYEEILLLSPDDDEAYLLLGHCRLLMTDYEKAKSAFLNAIHIDPKNAQEITRLYENVLVENPQDDAAYTHLGFANWILGREGEAKECFRQALLINPDNLEAAAALSAAVTKPQ